MSGLLSRLFGKSKSTAGQIKKKVSPLSTKDFCTHAPEPPTDKVLKGTIYDHILRTSANEPAHVQDFLRRQMFFDMRFRCGANGRCMIGANMCTYPKCFTWRPSIKGGDVLAEKGQIEESILAMSGKTLPKPLKDLIEESQLDENLEEVAKKIGDEIEVLFERAAAEAAEAAKEGDQQKKDVAGDARISDDLSGKIIILAVWRAVVLVNARKDEAAVESLFDVIPRIPKEHRGALYSSAAGWATLHDMEVRFFRTHLAEFPELREELPIPDIDKQSDALLDRVVKGCNGEAYFIEHCAHEVFGKEISAIIARAQNAQESDDLIEDPMATPFVSESVRIYKNRIGGDFWEAFMKLSMMPPLSPAKEPPAGSTNQTPRYILDALGRSMLLHHIAGVYGPLPGELRQAEQKSHQRMLKMKAERKAEGLKKDGENVDATEAEGEGEAEQAAPQITPEQEKENMLRQKTIVSRMRELIEVVKNAQGGPPPAQPIL